MLKICLFPETGEDMICEVGFQHRSMNKPATKLVDLKSKAKIADLFPINIENYKKPLYVHTQTDREEKPDLHYFDFIRSPYCDEVYFSQNDLTKVEAPKIVHAFEFEGSFYIWVDLSLELAWLKLAETNSWIDLMAEWHHQNRKEYLQEISNEI